MGGLLCLVCLAGASAVQAQEGSGPARVELLTSVSSEGGAVVEVQFLAQENCDAVAGVLSLAGPGGLVVLNAVAYAPCAYAVMPDAALAPGRYCLEVGELDSGLHVPVDGERCMDVTGVAADPSAAQVVIGDPADARLSSTGHAPEHCVPCDGMPAEQACTRSRQSWQWLVTLEGVAAELSSTHLIAMVTARMEAAITPPEPNDEDFVGLDSHLGGNLLVPIPQGLEQSCVYVYARPYAGGDHTLLGEACAQPDGTLDTRVLTYQQAAADCESTYATRWCTDNAECEDPVPEALAACHSYDDVCRDDGGQAGAEDGAAGGAGDDAEPGANEEAAEAAPEPTDRAAGIAGNGSQTQAPIEPVHDGDMAASGGCRVGAGTAAAPGWLLFALFALRRRQGRRQR